LAFSLCLAPGNRSAASAPLAQKDDVLLSTMQRELQRAQASLGTLDPAPYFLSYSVYDQSRWTVLCIQGSLVSSFHVRRRSANVSIRIGSAELDNTHGAERKSDSCPLGGRAT